MNRNLLKETMTVIVNGKEEQRFVSHYENERMFPIAAMRPTYTIPRAVPELAGDEKALWLVGSMVPHIVQTK